MASIAPSTESQSTRVPSRTARVSWIRSSSSTVAIHFFNEAHQRTLRGLPGRLATRLAHHLRHLVVRVAELDARDDRLLLHWLQARQRTLISLDGFTADRLL